MPLASFAFILSISIRAAAACDCSCFQSGYYCDADGVDCTSPGPGGCQAHSTGYHCYNSNASRSCAFGDAAGRCCDGESSFGAEVCSQEWCTSPHRNQGTTSPVPSSGNDCWAGTDSEECSCSEGEARCYTALPLNARIHHINASQE